MIATRKKQIYRFLYLTHSDMIGGQCSENEQREVHKGLNGVCMNSKYLRDLKILGPHKITGDHQNKKT